MESMQLSEQETRLFNELFTMCDTENTGRVFGPKASELFMNSGLSTDTLHQVMVVYFSWNKFLFSVYHARFLMVRKYCTYFP